jgi:hypothetical protein
MSYLWPISENTHAKFREKHPTHSVNKDGQKGRDVVPPVLWIRPATVAVHDRCFIGDSFAYALMCIGG